MIYFSDAVLKTTGLRAGQHIVVLGRCVHIMITLMIDFGLRL